MISELSHRRPLGRQRATDAPREAMAAVRVELGRTHLPAAQALDLPGGVLKLDQDVDSPVSVYAGSRLIGQGVLVKAGDRIAVKMTRIGCGQ